MHNMVMELPVVTIVFLGLAVLVAIGILAAVAAPHLRERDRTGQDDGAQRDPRHTSRTRR
ncbi:hypothetical protein GCM10009590_09670 [Brachybacterium alimentarium]